MTVLADGRRALSGSHDRTLRLWDLETGAELRRFEGMRDRVTSVALLPDGRRALSGSQTGRCGCGISRPAPSCAGSRGMRAVDQQRALLAGRAARAVGIA